MKFTPEEMAYEAPADVSNSKRFSTIARGKQEWTELLAFKRGYVRLDPDLRAEFADEKAVNAALRMVKELRKLKPGGKRAG